MSNGGHQRSSLFAGLLLILLGIIFFANQFYPEFGLGHLIERYWPVLVILWGVAKLIEHYSAQKSGEPRGTLLSGGEAALLILLALVLATFVFRDWIRHEFPGIEIHLPGTGRPFVRAQNLPPVEISAGAHVTVDTSRGDIKIVGVDGNELRVTVHASGGEGSRGATDDRLQGMAAVIDRTGDGYLIHPANQSGNAGATEGEAPSGTIDFEVMVPRNAPVTANASHGDISAEGVAGALDVRAQSGDTRIHDAGAGVSIDCQKGDVRIRNVAGSVQLRGGGGDVEISGVTGDVAIDGAFVGDIKVQKTHGAFIIKSPRAEVSVAQMSGELSLDSGDLSISGATGLVKVNAQDKDVAIDGAIDRLEISDSRGDIKVRFNKVPGSDISITSDTGDVKLLLPGQSSFQLAAVSRSGDVECEFAGPSAAHGDKDENRRIDGFFKGTAASSSPAPRISIATNYGDIEVNKS